MNSRNMLRKISIFILQKIQKYEIDRPEGF